MDKTKIGIGVVLMCIGIYGIFMGIIIADTQGVSMVDPAYIVLLLGVIAALAVGLTLAIVGAAED